MKMIVLVLVSSLVTLAICALLMPKRTVNVETHKITLSITDFGGKPDGLTDNSKAMDSVFSFSIRLQELDPLCQPVIYFPPGVYATGEHVTK